MKVDYLDMTEKEAEELMLSMGHKAFRGRQFFRWIQKGEDRIENMTDLGEDLREALRERGEIMTPSIEEKQEDPGDGTVKYLLSLKDGNRIEAVLMRYRFGNSICISSQAGCRMGCGFCASTVEGLERDLTAGEMTGQIRAVAGDSKEKINRVVIMGTGEPFDNYDNLYRFIRIVNNRNGMDMGMRNITVSTCGIIPGIRKFAEDFPQVNLAVSLHSAVDEVRTSLMPVNRSYPLDRLLEECRRYTEKTGRRITFEYALIDGVNDRLKDIEALTGALKGMLCHVNLIRLNKVEGKGLQPSDEKRVDGIWKALGRAGITATVRRQLGADIDGACGQLRLRRI